MRILYNQSLDISELRKRSNPPKRNIIIPTCDFIITQNL